MRIICSQCMKLNLDLDTDENNDILIVNQYFADDNAINGRYEN